MSAREDLARLINNGVDTWRTPLEAADAITKAGYGKLDAVLAIARRLEASAQCEDREIAYDIFSAVNDAWEADQ